MLIMAEVTAEMGDELRAAALASHTSVAAEVGRRLERLARLESVDNTEQLRVGWDNKPFTVAYSAKLGDQTEADILCDLFRQIEEK